MASELPYTPAMVEQVNALLDQANGYVGNPEVWIRHAAKLGIAFVDRSRSTFLIDQAVYEGVCFRLQRERRIRPPHRTIDASTWRSLTL